MTSLEATFQHDLERCARRVYELRTELAERRARRAVELIFDRERRVLIGLTGQLMASIALIPWLGPYGVVAGLAVLYFGTFASAFWTLGRVRRVSRERSAYAVELSVRRALDNCPPLDPAARALLVRLGNLVAIPRTEASVALLRAALADARARPELRGWPLLDDLAAVVEHDADPASGAPVLARR